jgi:two-component system cell cycle sensor histidine kinase/response regulator CckA
MVRKDKPRNYQMGRRRSRFKIDEKPGICEKTSKDRIPALLDRPEGAHMSESTKSSKSLKQLRDEVSSLVARLEKTEAENKALRETTCNREHDLEERLGEEKFHQMFNNTPLPALIYNVDTVRIIDVNQAAIEHYGYTKEEFLGMNIKELRPKEDIPYLSDTIKKLRRDQFTGPTQHVDFRHRKKDGTIIRVEVTGYPLYPGSRNRVAIMTDITESKTAEDALKESEETLWSLINATEESLLLIDAEGKILVANETVGERLGKPVEEIIGTAQYDYFPLEVAERRKQQYDVVVRTGKPLRFEDERSGRFYETCAFPVFDVSGKVSKIAIFSTDITMRKLSEEEKSSLQAQLRQSQKMEAIGTLAGGIAHDFNNILTVMDGYGTLLQMELDTDNPLRVYADQVLRSVQNAASLTQGLLAFSRQQPTILKPLAVNEIIRGTEKLLKRLLREDIILKTDLTEDDTTVMADATQMDQILFNLATNARDAMHKGVELTIGTRRAVIGEEFKQIHGWGEPGIYVVIFVSDTGIGMDEQTKGRIFDPFFTTKEVGKGTGLGLSTIYGIVKQHNGYINVYSEINAGSTFEIYLPFVEAPPEEKIPLPQIRRGKETILVAEDNEAVRHLIRKVLSRNGYIVIEAIDGADAIDKFNSHPETDLFIIDSVMPGKNGREVYDEITKSSPHAKVLFMSGHTKDVVLDKGIEDKIFCFIPKPLSPNELLRRVIEILDGKE